MSEPQEQPPEPVESQEPDYSNESVEELEKRMADGEAVVTERSDDQEPEPVAEEPPPTEEVEQAPEPEAEPAPEGVEAPPEAELEISERDLQIEEYRLRTERAEIGMKRQEDLASRNAGLYGHLKKQMDALTQAARAPQQEPEEEMYAEPAPRPVQERAPIANEDQSRLAELELEERKRAANEVYSQFLGEVARDLEKQPRQEGVEFDSVEAAKELMTEMSPIIQQQMEPYRDMTLPLGSVRKIARLVLDSAYVETRLARVTKLRAEAEDRKATQTARIVKQKQAAAPAGSGSTPGPKPRKKSPGEMTAEEADAEMIRLYGDGHAKGRLR